MDYARLLEVLTELKDDADFMKQQVVIATDEGTTPLRLCRDIDDNLFFGYAMED